MKRFNLLLVTFIYTHGALGTLGTSLSEETKEQEGGSHQVKTLDEARKFHTLNFDEIRTFAGGFKSSRLRDADCIIPSMIDLLKTEIEDLVSSPHVINLETLNLRRQKEVNNDMINTMSENTAFARIKDLDLSATSITPKEALKAILDSKILGSERVCKTYPPLHGRYCCPWSEVRVTIGNSDDYTVYDDSYEPDPLNFNPEKEHHQGFSMKWHYTKEGKVEENVVGVKTLRVSRY